uniref:Peptidoglycan recognition protein family domain-containing protein n=1 Tax=Dendroctonus ponderosae TaxID=77166 RepID=A0AAR5P616_DENPD
MENYQLSLPFLETDWVFRAFRPLWNLRKIVRKTQQFQPVKCKSPLKHLNSTVVSFLDSAFDNTPIIEHDQPHATKQKPSLASIQVLLPLAGFIAVGLVLTGIIVWRVRANYATTNEEAVTELVSTTVDYPLFVPREGWNALEPTSPPIPIAPALVFVGKHTGGSSCATPAECVARVQEIQREHMEVKGLADISYNFLIGGDGRIYTGRGWGVENEGRNDSVDVALIGDFNIEVPTTEMVFLVRRLENRGPREGGLDYANYWAVNHNQTEPTDSPGAHLFARLASNGYFHYSSAVCYRNVSGGFEVDYQCPP